MLYFSVGLSALLLLIANGWARATGRVGPGIVGLALAFLLVALGLMGAFFPAPSIQALLTIVAVVACRIVGRPSAFLALSCGAAVVGHAVSVMAVIGSEREYARLRSLYPYESLEARLGPASPIPPARPLPEASRERLSRLEGELDDRGIGLRTSQLRRLHEGSVELFINSPGFGVGRFLYPKEWNLAVNLRRDPMPRQPGARFPGFWSPGEYAPPPVEDVAPLGRLLEEGLVDFVYPRGFGWFKDRRHVAGFVPHRFGEVPGPAPRWAVRNVELVSLLLHDPPKVYDSDHLPRMDRLGEARTRPLDAFERFALPELERGEDLVATGVEGGLRMLGALRGTGQCVRCHGGERGDLLGAFTYALTPAGHESTDGTGP